MRDAAAEERYEDARQLDRASHGTGKEPAAEDVEHLIGVAHPLHLVHRHE
jgi:hypothetical protein